MENDRPSEKAGPVILFVGREPFTLDGRIGADP
jgi:hypothetical protein